MHLPEWSTLTVIANGFTAPSRIAALSAVDRPPVEQLTVRAGGVDGHAIQTEEGAFAVQQPAARGIAAKISEAATAVALTLRYGREPLLAHYLRIVPYGNGSHGIAHE